MKIGILTLPLHTNYGGILQAYALQTVLERMGHEVKVITKPFFVPPLPFYKKPLAYTKRAVMKYIFGMNVSIRREYIVNQQRSIKNKYTRPFVEQFIHELPVKKLSQLKKDSFDAIVVGSDQIWRPLYYRFWWKDVSDAFLSFAKDWDIKRVAYAPSFGTEEWEYTEKETRKVAQLLQKFNAISVREHSAIDLCKHYLGVDVQQVLDPTMLLTAEDYNSLLNIQKFTGKHPQSMMCYILDNNESIEKIIHTLSKKLLLTIHRSNSPVDNKELPIEERIQPPVENWIAGFADADYVITDSFHACVFSILFKKNFIVIGNIERGYSRFQSLLSMFGLENRLLSEYNTKQINDILNTPIEWDSVYQTLDKRMHESFKYLKMNLE